MVDGGDLEVLRVRSADEAGHEVGLLVIDLDGFKQVNDTLGHDAGDKALIRAAQRIRAAVRSVDTPARLGGDEFAVLLHQVSDHADPERIAKRLVEAMNDTIGIDGTLLPIGASIGVAFSGTAGCLADDLLHRADTAMYEAKRRGKGTYQVHQPRHDDSSRAPTSDA